MSIRPLPEDFGYTSFQIQTEVKLSLSLFEGLPIVSEMFF
jgi:hypothetical protein